MKRNMGTADRTIRFVVAILLATLYLTGVASGSLGVTLMVIALIFILTSISGFCPIYSAFQVKRWERQ
jgi:hypothetical protein